VRSARGLRVRAESRLADLKQQCAALRHEAIRPLQSFNQQQANNVEVSMAADGEIAKGSVQSTPRMNRAVSHPRVSPFSSGATAIAEGGALLSSRSEEVLPKAAPGAETPRKGKTPPARQHRAGSEERRRVQVTRSVGPASPRQSPGRQSAARIIGASGRKPLSSPRQSPLRAGGASEVLAERRVRFAERPQESPRVQKQTRAVPKSRSSPSATHPIAQSAGIGQASMLLPAIAALRGEVEIVSAAAGTDPSRYRAQLAGAVRQRLATVEIPLDPSPATSS